MDRPCKSVTLVEFIHKVTGVITMTSFFKSLSLAASAAVLVVLTGCAGMTNQEKGIATGAVVGGVVGNVLCGGVLCTGAGAAVGGVIGNEVSKKK